MLTIFPSWPALLTVTGITIFSLTNFVRADLSELMPVTNDTFHFFSYAFFAILWVRYISRLLQTGISRLKWWAPAFALPLALLIVVKIGSVFCGKKIERWDVIIAVVGITTAVVAQSLIDALRGKMSDAGENRRETGGS
jgi:hypothetical protein